MYILFSPSEGKQIPASAQPKNALEFLFHTAPYKKSALESYLAALRSGDEALICKIFGAKTLELDTLALAQNLLQAPRLPAIELYSGVAYKALDFKNLPQDSQAFLLDSVLICSNLFGFVRASDLLPFYKLHQGAGFEDFSLKTLYAAQKHDMDTLITGHNVLDLRAEIYTKVYPLSIPHTQVVFLKNGKKLSHASKLYRGLYLRQLALTYPKASGVVSLTTSDSKFAKQLCSQIKIESLELRDITDNAHCRILTYEIKV
ncbi:peroxide stress protein YaaA [uncultured Helicobacter sp.]|uniref:peroxide stress protein YaaA n=1 Tax=uncultured Helicobacter sp. TaxID=175537 RepID=UPI00374E9A84